MKKILPIGITAVGAILGMVIVRYLVLSPLQVKAWRLFWSRMGKGDFRWIDDFINCGLLSSDIVSPFSVTCWAKGDAFGSNTWITNRLVTAHQASGSTRWSYGVHDDSGTKKFAIYSNTGDPFVDTGSSVDDDTWYHFAMVYDGSKVFGYLNGVIDIEQERSITTDVYGSVKIGIHDESKDGADKRVWNGTIDEVKIFNLTLSADQIYQEFLAGNDSRNANILVDDETTIGDNWKCEVTPNDGYDDGIPLNSSEVEIKSDSPNVTTPTLFPATAYTNSNITCNTTPDDAINSTLNVEYWWYNGSTLELWGNKTGVTAGANTLIDTLGSGNISRYDLWNEL